MRRFSQKSGILSGICLLLNVAAFFLPLLKQTQENYPTIQWSGFSYIQELFTGKLSGGSAAAACVVIFILIPLLLSVLAGITGLIKRENRKNVMFLLAAVAVTVLYICLPAVLPVIREEAKNGQIYTCQIGLWMHIVFSAAAAVFAVSAVIPERKSRENAEKTDIPVPQFEEIRRRQEEEKFRYILDENRSSKTGVGKAAAEPRGVMVGISGLYQGAEVPLSDGNWIRLGRLRTNDLIFEGQARVSRNHCQIRWDAGKKKFIIRDYSSNGTYVDGSAECLPQNLDMEVSCGSILAIGDQTNTFRLE